MHMAEIDARKSLVICKWKRNSPRRREFTTSQPQVTTLIKHHSRRRRPSVAASQPSLHARVHAQHGFQGRSHNIRNQINIIEYAYRYQPSRVKTSTGKIPIQILVHALNPHTYVPPSFEPRTQHTCLLTSTRFAKMRPIDSESAGPCKCILATSNCTISNSVQYKRMENPTLITMCNMQHMWLWVREWRMRWLWGP